MLMGVRLSRKGPFETSLQATTGMFAGVFPLVRGHPFVHPSVCPVCLYADAFVRLHGVRRAANKWLPDCLQASSMADSTNGWEAVFLASNVRKAFRSQVPVSLLVQSSPTKAYIFWLEAIAQVLSVICIQPFVKGHLVCFADNVAAEHALQKGYTKDAKFTKLLGAFWGWVASKSLSLSFHRLTSAANVSDGISRGDLAEAQELGCQFENPQFDQAYNFLRTLKSENSNAQPLFAHLEKYLSPGTRTRVGTACVSG